MNGRLYRSLQEKADELQQLTEYNENILESIDSGILVLDLNGHVARWNRAHGDALRAGGARRCWAARLDDDLPRVVPGGAARQPGAGPAGRGRIATSTSCTCPPPTGAA